MKNKVFLGGTYNSTWREKIMPHLTVNYFNPVVEDWTSENKKIEDAQKREVCNIHLYVITSAMTGVYSIAEMVDSSHNVNKETIIQIVPEGFTEGQLKSLEASAELAHNQGATIIIDDNFDILISELNYVESESQSYLDLIN